MREIAESFAPVFAQKVSHEWPAADQIAPVDFAGSITNVADNVKKLFEEVPYDTVIERPTVYYSACETTTHYFIVYAIYHVFDWWKRLSPDNLYDLIRDSVDEHAHDMEGALVIVRKEPELIVDGLVTVSHRDFFLYTEPRIPRRVGESSSYRGKALSIAKFNETVDGNIWLDLATKRIKLYIQSRGHGIRGDHKAWGGGDAVWYYVPALEDGQPNELNDADETAVIGYELVDIFAPNGLWENRFNRHVFRQNRNGQWGFAYRAKMAEGALRGSAANPPWSWNDHNDASPIGEIATDPARFIVRYAQGWGPVSQMYLHNPYLGIRTT